MMGLHDFVYQMKYELIDHEWNNLDFDTFILTPALDIAVVDSSLEIVIDNDSVLKDGKGYLFKPFKMLHTLTANWHYNFHDSQGMHSYFIIVNFS